MAVFKRGGVWWYKFYFAGQFIRESAKTTSKTVAEDAKNQRRRKLEQGYHNHPQRRENRIRQLRDVADEYLADYKLRFRGITFAEYAIGHVVSHLGEKLLIDIDETEVLAYQSARLKESASPKSINEGGPVPSDHDGRTRRRDSSSTSKEEETQAAVAPQDRKSV